eukprot:gnl/TRDRNA2_/TRDRNA2_56388_c0_seq1.p2 gnl/TRDRNA2_/TRDRNA2_56388_c0~~gnl/TRDRNA2_/TRDRNA2_56388_c0_seq1.p2  ORF type:complete len:123 (-),score=17.26 gnl/TRDRNA2_/TRDRNA2_56388_c0_seq1:160-528(-)
MSRSGPDVEKLHPVFKRFLPALKGKSTLPGGSEAGWDVLRVRMRCRPGNEDSLADSLDLSPCGSARDRVVYTVMFQGFCPDTLPDFIYPGGADVPNVFIRTAVEAALQAAAADAEVDPAGDC